MKKGFLTSVLLVLVLSLAGCVVAISGKEGRRNGSNLKMSPTLGGKLFTSAWIQRSAEYQALCQQAYNIATLRLEEFLSTDEGRQRAGAWAIVTDIDETILDNSPNSVHQALLGEDYTDRSWDEWCQLTRADTLSGAKSFFDKAHQAGLKIFYISNRTENNRQGTLANLKKYGFPQVVDEQLLLRSSTSDKTSRRNAVLQQYNILMLLGDNLGDFDHLFDSSDEQTRSRGVVTMANEFGRRFIVLPNPNYGTWEKAMNGGYPSLSEKDDKLRRMLLSH